MNDCDKKGNVQQGQNTAVIDQTIRKSKKKSLYAVVLFNYDYTPMFFVVDVLERFFYMDREKAFNLMLTIHVQGKGLCGVFSLDVAQTKAMQVTVYAREYSHPLLCKIEKLNE